ncbi:MAG: hypothetical protein ACRD1X_22140 [Vicinamibacteria bacterium]
MTLQRDPSRPGVFHDRQFGAVRKVPGVVFFDEELVEAAAGLEREFFKNISGKGTDRSTLDPPLYSSFVRSQRLMDGEILVVDRIRVKLSDREGWEVPPDVRRWFGENVRLRIEVNRVPLVDGFLGELYDDGIRMSRDHRRRTAHAFSPRDPICSDQDIYGRLIVLRDPGRSEAIAIVRVEAVGAWLVEVRNER